MVKLLIDVMNPWPQYKFHSNARKLKLWLCRLISSLITGRWIPTSETIENYQNEFSMQTTICCGSKVLCMMITQVCFSNVSSRIAKANRNTRLTLCGFLILSNIFDFMALCMYIYIYIIIFQIGSVCPTCHVKVDFRKGAFPHASLNPSLAPCFPWASPLLDPDTCQEECQIECQNKCPNVRIW